MFDTTSCYKSSDQIAKMFIAIYPSTWPPGILRKASYLKSPQSFKNSLIVVCEREKVAFIVFNWLQDKFTLKTTLLFS